MAPSKPKKPPEPEPQEAQEEYEEVAEEDISDPDSEPAEWSQSAAEAQSSEGSEGSEAEADGDEPDSEGSEDEPTGKSQPRDPNVDIYGESDYPPEEEAYPEDAEEGEKRREEAAVARSGQRDDTKVGSRALALRDRLRDGDHDRDEDEESEESTKAGGKVRLEVTAGPDAGRVKKLRKVRMVIGRSSDCDFVLNDSSVSRRHVELVQGEKGVLLRDLGSGNGTRVNGEPATEQILQHEDEIALGRTRIRFHDEETALKRLQAEVEEARSHRAGKPAGHEGRGEGEDGQGDGDAEDGDAGGAFSRGEHADDESEAEASLVPSTAWGRAQKQVGWSGLSSMQRKAVLAGVMLGLVMVGSLFFLTRPSRPLPPDPRQVAAGQRIEEARIAFEAGRYEEAMLKLDAAERLQPGSDKDHLKDRIAMETAALQSLKEAELSLEAADFLGARAALKKIPDRSMHRERRDALVREAIEKEADAIYRQVAAAFETQNVEAAERALRIVTPEAREILGKRLSAFEERLDELRAEAERRAEAQRQEREEELEREREAELQTAFASVARRFHAGEYDRAVLEIDRVVERYPDNPRVAERAAELRKLIPTFGVAYDDGRRKFEAESLDNAVRPLQKARELYRQIELPGALGIRLDQDLTTALVAAGEGALQRSDWSAAARYFRDALNISENEPGARKGMERLNRQAEQIYLEGMRLWSTDPITARTKLALAADIASPDSATYRKAREQLGNQ